MAEKTPAQQIAIERTVAMAASMATAVLENGLAVGLCVWNDGWKIISEQRGKRHCRDILAALAELPANTRTPPDWLLQRAAGLMGEGVTPMLFTPRNLPQGLGEMSRTPVITVWSEGEQAANWFKFDPSVDFTRSMPAGDDPQLTRPSGK
jgi:hypothetical protein